MTLAERLHPTTPEKPRSRMKAYELEKKLTKKKLKTVSELKHLILTRPDQNPNFCLFLGAGASRNSGIRTAGEMIEQWREEVCQGLGYDTSNKTENELILFLSESATEWYESKREYASLIEHIYPLQKNRRKFVETEVADKIPSIGYAYLVRLAEAGFLRTIFTTNFDDLLNEAFYQFSSERAIVCAHDSSVRTISITARRTKIIKLHGDYLFDDLKNTTTETQLLEQNMKEKLSEFLKKYGLILAGYSGSDKSIMRNLENMLDDPMHLQNGLFWCFRGNDEVTQEALDILGRTNSFYVITPGFDELMADLYSMLVKDSTPFSSKFASDRATNVIDSYLSNEHLKASASPIIKKHLDALEADKNVSLVSDMMKEFNVDRMASSGLSDQNLLVFLEIERAMKDRNPEAALARLGQELLKTADRRFKEILLHRRFVCSMRLHKIAEAKDATKELLSLEPANFYVALDECSLLENRSERVLRLQQLATENPFSSAVLNRYAYEARRALEAGDKLPNSVKMDDVIATLKRSTEVNPSLDNSAWDTLFTIHSRQSNAVRNKELLISIVEKHLTQDAYSANTTAILFRYCLKFKTTEFKDKQLFTYLQEAYEREFPRDYCSHLSVFADAAVEFGWTPALQKLLESVMDKDEVKDSPDFAILMMDVYYNTMRDIAGAINYARGYLRKNKKTVVERQLLDLYLDNVSVDKARELHKKLEGAISQSQWLELDAKIMEYEGRYQNAIDLLEVIPDRRDFLEKHTPTLSFLELKMESYGRSTKRCKSFLQDRAFNLKFESVIINYEFSKKKEGGKIDLKRIANILAATEDEMVKGVCQSLLGEDAEALSIIRVESEKKFSKINDCLRWPVLERHKQELHSIRNNLLKAKRSFSVAPKF